MSFSRSLLIFALAVTATAGLAISPTAVGSTHHRSSHRSVNAPTLVAALEPGVITPGETRTAAQGPLPPQPDNQPQPPRAAAPEPPPPPPPAYGGGYGGGGGGGGVAIGSTQQALINSDRAGAGLPPLQWSGCLAGVASGEAARMARDGAISHAGGAQRSLGCGLGSQAGENVGFWSGGINDAQLNSMFMASGGHRANIMGPYRYVGTAWAVAPDGKAYIAVEFG